MLKIWADRIESDQNAIDAYGTKGAKMTFAELVDEYMQQWQGKSLTQQQSRSLYWSDEINADKIRMALKTLLSGKCKAGGPGGIRRRP